MTLTIDHETRLRPEELAERLFAAGLAAQELLCVHLGHRLGLYRALAEHGPLTPPTLADAAEIGARYAREWLEQQAAAGLLEVADTGVAPDDRTYALPSSYAEVLVNEEGLNYAVPFGDFVVCLAKPMDALVEAYRSGGGVHHSHYDPEHRWGQGAFSRPGFMKLLPREWLPNGVPDVHRRLLAKPGARIADLGCGLGWAGIGLACAYPDVLVDGFDIDAPSIAEARRNAEAAGVADRVTFRVHDATDASLTGAYDLVCMVEVLHDVARPVELLATARRLLAPEGSLLVIDERVGERFSAPADAVERFMYTCSVLHCLPIALVEQPSAATGTVLRPEKLRAYAADAGFADPELLPIENDFFRFYRLRPASQEAAVTAAPPLVTRFVRFLETTEDPGGLFTADVFCDFNVPRWRYQFEGVDRLAAEIRHDAPNAVTVRHMQAMGSGFVIEAEIDVRISGEPYHERTLWLVTIDGDRITAITLYCSGEWDAETVARQQREAPALRP